MIRRDHRVRDVPRLPVRFLRPGDQVDLVRVRGLVEGSSRHACGVVLRVYVQAERALVQVMGSRKRILVKQGDFDAMGRRLRLAETKAIAAGLEAWGEALARKAIVKQELAELKNLGQDAQGTSKRGPASRCYAGAGEV